MEPKRPEVNSGAEQSAATYEQFREQAPTLASPEVGIDTGSERVEQRSETSSAATAAIPALPLPQTITPPTVAPQTLQADDDTPSVAGDDDLIEKEWVDQAKKIINQTKDDPYRREQEVSKLQADYLRKRYGRELGDSQ